jgi:hypothetical protein
VVYTFPQDRTFPRRKQQLLYFANRIEQLRRLKGSERGHAFDKGDLDPPHPREIDRGLRGNACVLKDDFASFSTCLATAVFESRLTVRP